MKKIGKLLLSALFISLLIIFGTSCGNGKLEGSDADKSPTKKQIKDAAIAVINDKIKYTDHDLVYIQGNELQSIQIKTPETAELLYSCIKNSKKIVDFTGIDLEPMPHAPIKIAGEESCYFDSIFINTPHDYDHFVDYQRNYQIVFTESDAAALREHVMKLKDDYIAGQSKQ